MPNEIEGALKVWWIPQVPGKAFEVAVASITEGRKLCSVLADYDLFQFTHRIKPDYANAGGISRFEDGEWYDLDDEEEDGEWERDQRALRKARA